MIPLNSVLVGYGYLQHAGAEWREKHCLYYHIHLIPNYEQLLSSISFAIETDLLIVTGRGKNDEVNVGEEIQSQQDTSRSHILQFLMKLCLQHAANRTCNN